ITVRVVVRLTSCGWAPKVEQALLNVFGVRLEEELGSSAEQFLAQIRSRTLGSSECQEADQDREVVDHEGREP
ncbi:MAG TPA: hypothetical protein VFO40_00870, partial [Chthoniobacterales bacterium]|nr:hypothetical protein [Chthoniobacterales bacterium]